MMVTKKQLRGEAKAMGELVSPRLAEFCDSFVIFGIRVGGEHGLTVSKMLKGGDQRVEMENLILAEAAEIARRRGVG